ncbi:MAG: SAP domain-containing protein [Bacilli bacterium]
MKVLHKLKFVETCTATESLTELTIPQLKNLLKSKGINATGKKQELLNNIIENITEEELSSMFSLRKYRITKLGKKVIENHPEIIKKHGTKK